MVLLYKFIQITQQFCSVSLRLAGGDPHRPPAEARTSLHRRPAICSHSLSTRNVVTADFWECCIFFMVNNGEQKHVRDQGSGHVRDCNTRVNLELFKMLLEEFENLDGMQCDRLLNTPVHLLNTPVHVLKSKQVNYTNPTLTHTQTHIHKPDK